MDWYPHQEIEKKWRRRWFGERGDTMNTFRAEDGSSRPKTYVMIEFPYPSGEGLHVGHARSYSALDAVARKLRMQGKNVLFPFGWDAFGLPTESYAIKTGIHPAEVTRTNTARYKEQLQMLGLSFDWSREINTTDPAYYRWTQWIFLQFLKRGLAYQATIPINWCPKDKIGLANEEVVGGRCERCGTPVTRRLQKQWLLKITAYADRLLKDLDAVDYLNKITTQQVNWIGRSEGVEVQFRVKSDKAQKVLVATNNPSKVARVRKLLGNALPNVSIVTPNEAGLASIDIEEGSDLAANAEAKGRAYFGQTDLPILGMDTGLYLDGAKADPAMVKRNALAGADESRLSAEEIGKRMNTYYRELATKHGGEVSGYFLDALALVRPDGTIQRTTAKRELILTDKQKGEIDYHFPIRCLYRIKATNKYAAEQTEQEEIEQDLAPLTNALLTLLTPSVTVFTTRPDTLFGATYLVLAPEHPLVDTITTEQQRAAVQTYRHTVAAKSDLERTDLAQEKTGVFTGALAINPANSEKIPIWIADYVLLSYGTGAIMAVPAHDERDWEFAKSFALPIRQVIQPPTFSGKPRLEAAAASPAVYGHLAPDVETACWTGDGRMINSGAFSGQPSEQGRTAITDWLEHRGVAKKTVQYRLRDWVFSRQRYWGEPIPVVHCPACKERIERESFPLKFNHKHVWQRLMSGHKTLESRALNPFEKERLYGDLKTGMTIKAIFSETGETAYLRILKRWTFKRLEDFFKRKELIQKMNLRKDYSTVSFEEFRDGYRFTPDYLERIEKHGLVAWEIERVIPGIVPVPEDQLPVELPHVERFQPTDTGESPLASIPDWVNTPCPTCGGPAKRETDTMPNWAGSSWYFLRYTDPKNHKVFADQKKLEYWMPVDIYNGGMEHTVLHLLYSRFWHKFLFDLGLVPGAEPYRHRHSHGLVLGEDGQKMSKSRGNVVNPDDLVREYGADSLRLYEMFMGPFEEPIPWSTRGIVGVHRFLQGVYDLVSGDRTSNDADRIRDEEVVRIQHKTVKQVSEDLEQFKFNTAVSALMEFANTLKKADRSTSAHTEALRTLLLLLAPMAPHLASELWETAFGGDVSKQAWPAYDPARLIESTIPFVVQVNGKVRAQLTVPFDTTRKDAEHLALDNENVQKFVRGTPKKVIFVPNKLINFVV